MKKVSVIIPTLNEDKWLSSTLESLKNQTYKDFELIVKDGLSVDKTVEIAENYADKVVSMKDSSAGEARNQGAKYAHGQILVFLDADTLLAPNTLNKLVEDFQKYDAVLVFPRYLLQEKTMEIEGSPMHTPRPLEKLWFTFEDYFRSYAGKYASGMCMTCDSVAFNRIGGFNEKLKVCEDIEISYRFKKIGRIICDRDAVAYPSARRFVESGVLGSLLNYLTYFVRWHLGLWQPTPKIIR